MTKYNHPEAFCLMLYRCENCKAMETLWNSRDGVTPFTIGCRICTGHAVHIDWDKDTCIPDHVPYKGQRVFIDTPEELRMPLARLAISKCDGTEFESTGKEREERIKQLASGYRDEEPFIITWELG